MSKSNRIKGKYSEGLGRRDSSVERELSLEVRYSGLTSRHTPKQSLRLLPKITKQMRRASRANKVLSHEGKPMNILDGRASAQERGYAFIMSIVSTVTHPKVSV